MVFATGERSDAVCYQFERVCLFSFNLLDDSVGKIGFEKPTTNHKKGYFWSVGGWSLLLWIYGSLASFKVGRVALAFDGKKAAQPCWPFLAFNKIKTYTNPFGRKQSRA